MNTLLFHGQSRLIMTVLFCLGGIWQTTLTAQKDTIPMIKLVPAPQGESTMVPDSLIYHFPWAEGVTPPIKNDKVKRVAPAYFINDSLVTQLAVQALDPTTIDSVNVLKGVAAEVKHPGTAKSGVVLVYLKKKD